jgi:hypothetical protein
MELHDRQLGRVQPAVANGVVYVGSCGNNLYAFGLE